MQNKKRSKVQENKVAKDVGGKVLIASGALWFAKGDVRSSRFLIECKTTNKDFYNLSATTWEKIYREATKDGLRIPIMCIELRGKTLALLRVEDLQGLDNIYYKSIISTSSVNPTASVFKSLRIKDMFILSTCSNSKGSPFNLITIPWEDFLNIVREEETE